MTAALAHLFLTAATAKKSSSGSATFIIFIVVIGAAGYFLLLRPQQQKAKKQRAQQSDISVGDEITTIGGIVGTVLDIDNERVTIITGVEDGDEGGAPGHPTRLILVRRAIAGKTPERVPVQDDPDDELHFDNELDYGDQPTANGSADGDAGGAEEGEGERRADGGSGEGKGP